MARKLKVFRTPIGFHDAYVAAPSQKAALEAWGSDADLFSRGVAELVTDETLMREPLDNPGKVIRRQRGTAAEHLAALPEDKPAPKRPAREAKAEDAPVRRKGAGHGRRAGSEGDKPAAKARPGADAPSKPKARSKPKPRPSRDDLDAAEAALAEAEAARDAEVAELRRREQALQQERHAAERRHEVAIAKKEAAIAKAEERYRSALAKWRE